MVAQKSLTIQYFLVYGLPSIKLDNIVFGYRNLNLGQTFGIWNKYYAWYEI